MGGKKTGRGGGNKKSKNPETNPPKPSDSGSSEGGPREEPTGQLPTDEQSDTTMTDATDHAAPIGPESANNGTNEESTNQHPTDQQGDTVMTGSSNPPPKLSSSGNEVTTLGLRLENQNLDNSTLSGTPPVPKTPPMPPLSPKKRGHDDTSADELDEEPFNPFAGNDTFQDLESLQDAIDEQRKDNINAVNAEQIDEDIVVGHIDGLNNRSWQDLIRNPKRFSEDILKLDPGFARNLILDNPDMEQAYKKLCNHVNPSEKTVHFSTILAECKSANAVRLTNTRFEEMQHWPNQRHWACFLVSLHGILEEHTLFNSAFIRSDTAQYGTCWVFAKLCHQVYKNRPAAEASRKKEELRRQDNIRIVKTANATLNAGNKSSTDAARHALQALQGGTPKKKKRKTAKKPPVPKPNFSAVEDQVPGDESEDPNGAAAEGSGDGGEAAPKEDDHFHGRTDEEVFSAFFQSEMSREEKMRRMTAQARDKAMMDRAACLLEIKKHRPIVFKYYCRNIQLLFRIGLAHLDQIQNVQRPNTRVNPIRKDIHARIGEFETRITELIGAIDEVQGKGTTNPATAMSLEAEAAALQTDTDADQKEPPSGDSIPEMIDIPDAAPENATMKMFAEAQNSNAFSPTYIFEAMVEAGVLSEARKVMPHTQIPLKWWQVIFTKWATDRNRDRSAQHLRGCVLADEIGLGKTYAAAGLISKAIDRSQRIADGIEKIGASGTDYAEPGDTFRPHLFVSPAALCPQLKAELTKFSSRFQVHFVTGEDGPGDMKGFPGDNDAIWDEKNPGAINHIFIASYDYMSRHFGTQEYWSNVKKSKAKYCNQKRLQKNRVDWKKHSADFNNQPDEPPTNWMRLFTDKFCYVFADEGHECLRNPTSHWRTLLWLRPVHLVVMSGYPAPRSMEDFASYLRLMERQELRQAAISDEAIKSGYIHGTTNPFELDDDDPNSKFRFLYSNWEQFILGKKNGKSSKSSVESRMEQAMKAQPTLREFVIRRDMDTTPTGDAAHRIGAFLPKKEHLTVERIFSPATKRVYDNMIATWVPRMWTTHKNAKGESAPSTNTRAHRAMQLIEFFPPLGYLHTEVEAEKRPKEGDYDPNDERYNVDRESFFYDKSPIFKAYNRLPQMMVGGKGHRWRWIMKMCQKTGCTDFPDLDWDRLTELELAREILKWSPKLQAMLSIYTDWCLLRDEKVIFWFMTPMVQELAQGFFELLGHNVFSVWSATTMPVRADVADQWNQRTKKGLIRALFASARVFGTGFNLQKDSRVAVLVDTPDTDNREAQILGRQYRGGQLLRCYFYRLTVRGGYSIGRLSENLKRSTAASAAFTAYETNDSEAFDKMVPQNTPEALKKAVKKNWFCGFIRIAKDSVSDATEVTDFTYHYIFSEQGLAAVDALRAQENERRKEVGEDAVDDTWWPEPLDWQLALLGLQYQAETRTVVSIAGFSKEFTDVIAKLTQEEVSLRREKRTDENGGIDPDVALFDRSTPKKPKKSKTAHELERSEDVADDADVQFTEDMVRPSMAQIEDEEEEQEVSTPSKQPKPPIHAHYARILDIIQDEIGDAEAEDEQAAEGEEPWIWDTDDYNSKGQLTYRALKARVNDQPGWRPRAADVAGLDDHTKGNLTRLIRKTDRTFPGFKFLAQSNDGTGSNGEGSGKGKQRAE